MPTASATAFSDPKYFAIGVTPRDAAAVSGLIEIDLAMPPQTKGASPVYVTLLRPAEFWLDAGATQPGAVVWLDVEELGLAGDARVVSIRGPPAIVEGLGRVVTGTFRLWSRDVYAVHLVGVDEALQGTGNHPLYSLDRGDWVAIRDLRVGERLESAEGVAVVRTLVPLPGLHKVYNFEVEGEHEYLVGVAQVRAHNSCQHVRRIEINDFVEDSNVGRVNEVRDVIGHAPGRISQLPAPRHVSRPRAKSPGGAEWETRATNGDGFLEITDGFAARQLEAIRRGVDPPRGIRYVRGMANFNDASVSNIMRTGGLKGHSADFKFADKALARELRAIDPSIEWEDIAAFRDLADFTWHHHPDRRTMQLVPKGIHSYNHTGGMAATRNHARAMARLARVMREFWESRND